MSAQEKLAELLHHEWAHTTNQLLDEVDESLKAAESPGAMYDTIDDGPWRAQAKRSYSELAEEGKEECREAAGKMLAIVNTEGSAVDAKPLVDQLEWLLDDVWPEWRDIRRDKTFPETLEKAKQRQKVVAAQWAYIESLHQLRQATKACDKAYGESIRNPPELDE